ncbi:hypothetical protein GCM10010399_18040 [Dactylosporangium fulvum]
MIAAQADTHTKWERNMPKVTFVQADGASATYDFAVGKSLMLAAQSHGVDGILGEC